MEMEPNGGDRDTILYAKVIKKETVYMGIWDLMSFFAYHIFMKQRFSFFFYFVVCEPAGQLHKMFASFFPIFPIPRTFGLEKFLWKPALQSTELGKLARDTV